MVHDTPVLDHIVLEYLTEDSGLPFNLNYVLIDVDALDTYRLGKFLDRMDPTVVSSIVYSAIPIEDAFKSIDVIFLDVAIRTMMDNQEDTLLINIASKVITAMNDELSYKKIPVTVNEVGGKEIVVNILLAIRTCMNSLINSSVDGYFPFNNNTGDDQLLNNKFYTLKDFSPFEYRGGIRNYTMILSLYDTTIGYADASLPK